MAKRTPARTPSPHADDRPGGDRVRQMDGWSRMDGWSNVITGLGDVIADKRLGARFSSDRMTVEQAEELYRGDDMAARIVETLPAEMNREGFELVIGKGDKSMADDVMGAFEDHELGLTTSIIECMNWGRAYGGAGMLLGVDDGKKDLTEPLNLNGIKSFTWVTDVSPRELRPLSWYGDPTAPKFGQPETYAVMPLFAPGMTRKGSTSFSQVNAYLEVHESRVLRWEGGVTVSRKQLYENWGWPDSVLNRCNNVIRDFQQTWAATANLMQDFAQAVVKMEGLAKMLGSKGEKEIADRLRIMNLMRSVLRAIPLDAKDDFDRKTTPLSGVPDVLQMMCLRLCATARMPIVILMGQTPSGFSTGDIDLQWFYDSAAAEQQKTMKWRIKRLLELLMRSKAGPTKGRLPKTWDIEFRGLWHPTAVQSALIRLQTSQADDLDIKNQVLLPEEAALSRFGGPRYSTQTTIDLEAREKMAAEEEAEKDQPAVPPVPPVPGAVPPQPGPQPAQAPVPVPPPTPQAR